MNPTLTFDDLYEAPAPKRVGEATDPVRPAQEYRFVQTTHAKGCKDCGRQHPIGSWH